MNLPTLFQPTAAAQLPVAIDYPAALALRHMADLPPGLDTTVS